MNRLHAAPILDALRAAPMRVFDSAVDPKTAPPYVVAYIATSTPDATTLEDAWDRVECTATVHYVGGNAEACRILADRGWTALLGLVPNVPGRMCGPIRLIDAPPPRRDESTGQLIVDQVGVFQYVSVPAAG